MKIKIYKKYELAKEYFPGQGTHAAVQRMMHLINHCPPLLDALMKEGYRMRSKTFSLRQTLLIYEYLGEPESGYAAL